MQCVYALCSSVACVTLQYFCTLFHRRHDFREKVTEHKIVFWFSLQLLSQTVFILRRTERDTVTNVHGSSCKGKGKSVPLQAWSGQEGSRKLRLPDFTTTAQGGGKVVSLKYRPHLPPGNPPGTHFC